MNSSIIRNNYDKIISLWSDAKISKDQLKKVKLFNVFCLAWYSLMILALLEDLIKNKELTYEALITTLSMGISMSIIQYIHFRKHYLTANLSYILLTLILTFYFSNFLSTKQLLEYYYIFAPLISLVFVDIIAVNIIVLILAYLLFLLPNFYFNHYSIDQLSDISIVFFLQAFSYW